MTRHASRRGAAGFSMIEVLIALVVLAVGLLGLALLQTMNLRYTKSAHQRTQAVNLASELLDTMRANRSEVPAYLMSTGDFAGVPDPDPNRGCAPAPAMSSATNKTRWQCEVKEALGNDASAVVDMNGDLVRVRVTWDESLLPENTDGAVELETLL